MMRSARGLLAVLLILVLFQGLGRGQGSSTATVTGTITDQRGAAVPGAAIELLNTATNESRTQTTNDAGYYTFVSVPPGTYKVVFKKDGFRTTTMGPLDAQVGKSLTANVQLEIGTVAQTVEVIAGAGVELQTMDSSVGNVLDRKVLDSMPTLARDATAILLLQPLATPGFNTVGGGEEKVTIRADKSPAPGAIRIPFSSTVVMSPTAPRAADSIAARTSLPLPGELFRRRWRA
jgi:hypothetical protein